MDRKQFEAKLSDYARDALSQQERREIETYLQAHPERMIETQEAREMLELVSDIASEEPPQGLLQEAQADVLRALERNDSATRVVDAGNRFSSHRWMAAAAVLIAAVMGSFWWQGTGVVWADVVERIQNVHSLKVEGWIRGEKGERVPLKQWLQVPHSFRAEIGAGAERSSVLIDDEHRLIEKGGTVYAEPLAERETWSMHRVAQKLALPEEELLEKQRYEVERKSVGEQMVFSIRQRSALGDKVPGDIRFEVTVDPETRLPKSSKILQIREGQWQLIGEARYYDYDIKIDATRFAKPATTAHAIDTEAKEALWLERALTPLVQWDRVLYMPAGGVEIDRYEVERTKHMDSGHSINRGNGMYRHEIYRNPLEGVFRLVTNLAVEVAPELNEEIYSLRVNYRATVTQPELVQRLGTELGVRAEIAERRATGTRYTFNQNGRTFPTNSFYGGSETHGDDYKGKGVELGSAIRSMLDNAALNDLVEDYNRDTDSIELRWDGPPENDPFKKPVDIDVDFSGGWHEALAYLKKEFGVEMRRIREPVIYKAVVVTPR